MSDSLYDLLQPQLPTSNTRTEKSTHASDTVTSKYLSRLQKLDLAALQTTESQSLAQASHSTLLALQALSSRSSRPLIASTDHLARLGEQLPALESYGRGIRSDVQKLDFKAVAFSEKYSRSAENPSELLERRKRALLLSRNVDRTGDILELPALLSSAVHSAAAGAASAASGSTTGGANSSSSAANISATYNAALDLYGHVKRLSTIHPNSDIVKGIYKDATDSMSEMTTSLIQTLRGTNLKLAGGMRTVGWLRRVAPELASISQDSDSKTRALSASAMDEEGAFGATFLVCRLANLLNTLEALEPMRDLADQETVARKEGKTNKTEGSGHQTERYLKRFIELFREQSFAIVSMFRSIFPADDEAGIDNLGLDLDKMGLGMSGDKSTDKHKWEPLPSALTTFPLHLVENVLLPTLQEYLPNVADRSARESLMTQVLYCAGSLGRLGGDFTILLTSLYEDESSDDDEDAGENQYMEWVEIVKKHRVQAARLESLATNSASTPRSKAREGVTA